MKHCRLCQSLLRSPVIVAESVRDSKNQKVIQCQTCGHVQLLRENPKVVSTSSLSQAAERGGWDLNHFWDVEKHDTYRRISLIKRIIPPPAKVLDIGTGFGFFVGLLTEHGYSCASTETNKTKLAYVPKSVTIIPPDFGNADKPLDFEIVTMFHMLEHLEEPVAFLDLLRESVKSGCRIVIEVPNRDDLLLRESRPYFEFYWQKSHLSYFNRESLADLICRGGLRSSEIFSIQRYGLLNLMSWIIKWEAPN